MMMTTIPVIKIADAEGIEDDGTDDGKVTFTLSLVDSNGDSYTAGRDIMVNFATSSTTIRPFATVTTDYTSVDEMVTISKGSSTKTVDVTTKFDGDEVANVKNESDEEFTVTLSSPVHATIDGDGTAIGTILSNDTPVFEIFDVTQDEGNSSPNNTMDFEVILSSRPTGATGAVTVHYMTANASAMSGSDYTETTSVGGTPLSFPRWNHIHKQFLCRLLGIQFLRKMKVPKVEMKHLLSLC